MKTITDRLNELQAIAEKATPGPWHIDSDGENGFGNFRGTPNIDDWISLFSTTESGSLAGGDIDFIATFRTAGPELIEGLKVAVVRLSQSCECEVWMPPDDCECNGCRNAAALARISAILEGGK